MPSRFYRGPIGSGWEQFGASIGGALHGLGERKEQNKRRKEDKDFQVERQEDQQTFSAEQNDLAHQRQVEAAKNQWLNRIAEMGFGGNMFNQPSQPLPQQPFAGAMGVGQAITGAMSDAQADPNFQRGQVNAAAHDRRLEDIQRQIELTMLGRYADATRAGQTRGAEDVDVNAASEPFQMLGPWVQRMLELENQVPKTPQSSGGSGGPLSISEALRLAPIRSQQLVEGMGERAQSAGLVPEGFPVDDWTFQNHGPDILNRYRQADPEVGSVMTLFGLREALDNLAGDGTQGEKFTVDGYVSERISKNVGPATSTTNMPRTQQREASALLESWQATEADARAKGATPRDIQQLKATLEAMAARPNQ